MPRAKKPKPEKRVKVKDIPPIDQTLRTESHHGHEPRLKSSVSTSEPHLHTLAAFLANKYAVHKDDGYNELFQKRAMMEVESFFYRLPELINWALENHVAGMLGFSVGSHRKWRYESHGSSTISDIMREAVTRLVAERFDGIMTEKINEIIEHTPEIESQIASQCDYWIKSKVRERIDVKVKAKLEELINNSIDEHLKVLEDAIEINIPARDIKDPGNWDGSPLDDIILGNIAERIGRDMYGDC